MPLQGFTYNGIHSSKYSCIYIPSHSDLMDTAPSFDVLDTNITGRDGGYYYGNNLKPRDFKLKIFFEEINREERDLIGRWFDRNTEGTLVFDERPFVEYHVRPVSIISGEIYQVQKCDDDGRNYFSGTFEVTLRAYDPFGYMKYKSYDSFDSYGASDYSGILKTDEMPPAPNKSSKNFLLYNCGTQQCDTVIKIAGKSRGKITIFNNTNGTYCSLSSLPATGGLEISSYYGTVKKDGIIDFSYHDDGYLVLDSYGGLYKNILVETKANSNSVKIKNYTGTENLVGKYLLHEGVWRKITGYDVTTDEYLIAEYFKTEGYFTTKITGMNSIQIRGTNFELIHFSVDYIPRIY